MKLSTGISPIWRKYGLEEMKIYEAIKRCGFDCVDYDFCAANAEAWMQTKPEKWGREMKGRLSDNMFSEMTVVNPPPLQEMNSSHDKETPESSSSPNNNENNNDDHTHLEIQAV